MPKQSKNNKPKQSKNRSLRFIDEESEPITVNPVAKIFETNLQSTGEELLLSSFSTHESESLKIINSGRSLSTKYLKIKVGLIHIASFFSNIKLCKLILEKGGDINLLSGVDFTPLHYACLYSNFETVKFLIDNGADVNSKNFCDATPLMHACLYKTHGDILNHTNPLQYIINKIKIVKYLIEKGADVNSSADNGYTAAHVFIEKYHMYFADKNVKLRDENERTYRQIVGKPLLKLQEFKPLNVYDSEDFKYFEIMMEILIKPPFNILAKAHGTKTLLSYALVYENERLFHEILNKGGDINDVDVLS